jgi:hypothetical protein
MRQRRPPPDQPSLFDGLTAGKSGTTPPKPRSDTARKWRMPELEGLTVAEIRLRWTKRLTPAQVARVEAELSALPKALARLGFGPVQVERAFVRRRRA